MSPNRQDRRIAVREPRSACHGQDRVCHHVCHRDAYRPGLALPTALLAIVLLAVIFSAGFMLVNAERRTVNDQQGEVRALGIAQQGLDAYLRNPGIAAYRKGRTVRVPPIDYDTAWVPVNGTTGDTAIVIPRFLRRSTTGDTLYVISSLGVQSGKQLDGTLPAKRAVAEIATWAAAATVPIRAGWTSLSGILKNGVSGTLSGNDASPAWCGAASTSVAGVSVPTSPGYSGPTNPLSGNPPLDTTSLGGTATTAAASMAAAGMDWSNWSQGLNLPNVWRTQDHGGAFPSTADTTYYPVVYVNGDLASLPSGRGLLVVSGSLTINGSTQWDGIVLIGGTVTANGNDNIEGAVISGLNAMTSNATVPVASLGNGTKTIQYNSCEIKRALQGMKALIPRRGTWVDNWSTY